MAYVYASRYTLHDIKEVFGPPRRFTKGCFFAWVLLPIFWGMTAPTPAQTVDQPYNLQIGPVTLRADAGSTVSYNDNINLAESGRQEDFIITPDVNIHGLWQVTELNALTFDLGFGYERYLLHPNDSSPLIAPDSQAQFKIFIGDFKITLRDTFSFQNNPTQVGQLSNVSQFQDFTNDAGITVDWDVGDLTVTFAYDHTSFYVLQQNYSYLDYQADTVSPKITFNLSKTLQAGINASVASTRYDQSVQNNSIQLSGGPFIADQISENLALEAQGGWEFADYAQGGTNGDSSNISSFYGNVGITHRINDALQESLTFGRSFLPGITSNYTSQIYVNYQPTWHATTLFDIAPQFSWQQLQDSEATVSQNSIIFEAGLTVNFLVTQHSTATLSYNYLMKDSNLSMMSYNQDLVSLGLKYQF
jgi:hypothetical protein